MRRMEKSREFLTHDRSSVFNRFLLGVAGIGNVLCLWVLDVVFSMILGGDFLPQTIGEDFSAYPSGCLTRAAILFSCRDVY